MFVYLSFYFVAIQKRPTRRVRTSCLRHFGRRARLSGLMTLNCYSPLLPGRNTGIYWFWELRNALTTLKSQQKKYSWFFPPLFTLSVGKAVLSLNIVTNLHVIQGLLYFFVVCGRKKQVNIKSFLNREKKENWTSDITTFVLKICCIFTTLNLKTILKVRFRLRTFHEPNLIRIKADPNYLDRLN